MRNLGIGLAALLALAGCDKLGIGTKKDPPAAASGSSSSQPATATASVATAPPSAAPLSSLGATSPTDTSLPKECEDFIALQKCIMAKNAPQLVGQTEKQLKDAYALALGFPGGRDTLTTTCKQTTEAAVAAAKSAGCSVGGDARTDAAKNGGKYPDLSQKVVAIDMAYPGATCDDLALMRNEIYARHGMRFKTKKWHDHFARQSWYKPESDDVDKLLSGAEKQNITLIKNLEGLQDCNKKK